jgi:hypothetical protein
MVAMYCNGIVPLVLFIISLVLLKIILIKKTIKRKESKMEHVKSLTNNLNLGLTAMIETIWAIGTSVAATGVPFKCIYKNHDTLYKQ